MKNILIGFTLFFVFSISAYSQNHTGDSLFTGRICRLVLFNGYQAEGKITERLNDTLSFETEVITLHIPVKDIKFVMNPDVELSDREENAKVDYYTIIDPVVKIDTTEECDIYMDNKSVLSNVKLIIDTDSTLKTVKDKRSKIIGIAGIRKIVFKTSAPFGKGYLAGSAIGFAIGFIPFAFSKGGGHPDISGFGAGVVFGLICSIPAGLIGGVVGVLVDSDDVYLFNPGVTPEKIKRIRFAMEKHY